MSYISASSPSLTPALPAARRLTLSPKLILLLIIALAAILHSIHLSTFDISSDEAHSYLTATSSRPLFSQLQNDTNPPLYFLLLKYWTLLFGTSLAALRSLSLLFSLALIPLLALLARQCGASTRTTLIATTLLAFNPLQLYYAQDARNYSLSLLLLLLGLITFLHALKSNSKPAWLLHALLIAAAAYTHFLLIPLTLAYWLAAPFLKLTPKQYLYLFLAHAAAALLAIPILLLILHQMHTSDGTDWITPYWNSISHPLAIPKSLELLPFGSQMPNYIYVSPLTPILRLLALLLILLAAAAFLYPKTKSKSKILPDAEHEFKSTRWLLLTFTLWPLTFLLLYSLFLKPIYLHGRYDLLAQPTYLLLLAAGLSRLHNALTNYSACAMPSGAGAPLGMRRIAKALSNMLIPSLLILLLTSSILNRLTFPIDPANQRHAARADYLSAHLHPTDALICTGLEASSTQYQLDQHHLAASISSFPTETLSHPGWFMSDNNILNPKLDWPTQAGELLQQLSLTHKTIWIVIDRSAWEKTPAGYAPLPRQSLTETLLNTATAQGYHRADPNPTNEQSENTLRLISLTRP